MMSCWIHIIGGIVAILDIFAIVVKQNQVSKVAKVTSWLYMVTWIIWFYLLCIAISPGF